MAEYKLPFTGKEIEEKLGRVDELREQISQLSSEIVDLKAEGGTQTPLFAKSIIECTDQDKIYVLPDGYVYAYIPTNGALFINQLVNAVGTDGKPYNDGKGYKSGYYLGSDGSEIVGAGYVLTGYIPINNITNTVLRVSGLTGTLTNFDQMKFYNASFENISIDNNDRLNVNVSSYGGTFTDESAFSNTVKTFTFDYQAFKAKTTYYSNILANGGVKYVRFALNAPDLEKLVVTINEQIAFGTSYKWTNTEHAFINVIDSDDSTLEIVSGHYTPSVTQPSANKMRFSFTASEDWMSTVPDVDIELLKGDPGTKGDTGDTGPAGYAPVKGVDYWTASDKEEIENDNVTFITAELAKRVQLKPEFANRIEECTDTTKLYVLPDGYIYGNIKAYPTITYETHANKLWNGSAQLNSSSGTQAKNTNIVPVNPGDQFIYTGCGQYNASVFWLSSSALNSSAANNAIIVSKETYGTSGSPATVTVTAPAGAKYVMFVSWNYTNPGAVLEVTPLTAQTTWASTGHAFVPADYEDRIVALENKSTEVESVLKGKKIVYDGDSIAESRANNGGGYAKLIADKVGGTYVNQAVGGAYLRSTTVSGKHSVVDNLENLPKDADLYCFEGGINDYWNNATLGTFVKSDYSGSVDKTTVCGALETIFRYAINNFLGKPICFIIAHKIQNTAYSTNSNGNTFEDYRNAMIGICEKYSIPYYDAFAESGLNGWNTAQNNAYLTSNANSTADGTHPNELGYRRYYVSQLISLFERIMPQA